MPNNLSIKDASAATQSLKTTETTGVHTPHHIVDGTVTVTGPLTDAQLRATAVPISGTITANTGLTQPLTDTQLRASPVSVSGPLTDTQLRAADVPVSAASLPLPTGAATSANQTTANTSLLS